ncbi:MULTISPECIES: hypothetical protein [unclassified Streptomyces]|uniref:hypothetical protein n=1 Tax=unclassified Streptomyces TaxID=2593676 RepID=UPI00368ADD8E
MDEVVLGERRHGLRDGRDVLRAAACVGGRRERFDGAAAFDIALVGCPTREKSSVSGALTSTLNSFLRSWDRGNAH